ncbi:HEPN domain-containing protein [Methylolobus aquaticus]
MTPQLDEAGQLLGAAERDVVAFQILAANAAAPPEIVLSHAQQAVEKFIEAVFAAHGLVYRRTHCESALRPRAMCLGWCDKICSHGRPVSDHANGPLCALHGVGIGRISVAEQHAFDEPVD